MHVGIDVSALPYGRGVSRYTQNVVRALAARGGIELSLFGSAWHHAASLRKQCAQLQKRYPRVIRQTKVLHQPEKIHELFWSRLGMQPIQQELPGVDVFHTWDWLQPPDTHLPLVSTIHDLAILKFPDTAHPKVRQMHERSWQVLRKRDAEIIAVSHATKKDVVELLGFPAHRVHVVHEALPQEVVAVEEALTEEDAEQLKARMRLFRPYILFVGTREPRKNLARLIEAWLPMAKDFELIIAGETGWDDSAVLGKALKNPALRFLGRVSEQELAVLYGEAEVFVYPSLDEGFGLPVLEAFYHGTPVVTADVPALREVAGNAVEYVDPFSIEGIRRGIEKVAGEKKEAQQRRLQQMIIRLQLFRWERVAEETVQVYKQAVERGV